MTLRRTAVASAGAALALTWTVSAQPALARWAFHDETFGETITAPPGGTRAQTCAGRLQAVAGYGANIDVNDGDDPSAFQIPPEAKDAVDYAVWKAPPGFSNFDGARQENGQVVFHDSNGTRHLATLAGRVTTPRRAVLRTPVPANGNPHVSGTFVFTAAPISVRLRGVAPGDALGLVPADFDSFDDVRAIDCGLPLLKPKVDVVPGSSSNTVHPETGDELVPVRIFGSRRLAVRKITEVHLGAAERPADVPADLQPSLEPRDVNGDGRLDRLYYFKQSDTDIMCTDRSVKVTGQTTDHKRFQGKNQITPAGCAT